MILLDVDGVLVDFVGGALRAHGSDLKVTDLNQYQLEPQLGITPVEFWRVINALGPEFWRDLEPYPWFDHLYYGLKAIGRVMLVTKPSWSVHSYTGKKLWIDKTFGPRFREWVPLADKDLLARPTRCLVDDSTDNIASFLTAGGEACLFPQPWNGGSIPDEARIDELLARVKNKLL